MANQSYEYTFYQFSNNKVYAPTLETEIRISSITISLNYINLIGTDCSIIFKSTLSASEITTLDTIVANHTGIIPFDSIPTRVKVVEENSDTGIINTQGHYQATSIVLDIPALVGTYSTDLIYPYYISITSAQWFCNIESLGDVASFVIAPDTLIGTITQDANSGDTIIHVSDSVLSNIQLGYEVKVGNDELGKTYDVDMINKTITTEIALQNSYSASEATFVFITVNVVDKFLYTGVGLVEIGDAKIGSSLIPPNTTMRVIYNNINGLAKKIAIFIDYSY